MLWLLSELRDTAIKPITLGGLVPEVLTDGQDPPAPAHQGTGDVDLHIEVEVGPEGKGLIELESALVRAKFEPDPKSVGGWQWRVIIEGFSIRVDLLCDSPEAAAERVFPVSRRLGVMNLRGTRYVRDDYALRRLSGKSQSGEDITVDAQFAGLGGYLLTKCVSATVRQKPKDFYDLAYVLLYNRAGGPAAAAAAILSGPLAKHIKPLAYTLRELHERYRDASSIGTKGFVELHQLAAPGGNPAQLAQDAIAAVEAFVSQLLQVAAAE